MLSRLTVCPEARRDDVDIPLYTDIVVVAGLYYVSTMSYSYCLSDAVFRPLQQDPAESIRSGAVT
jgi:hypothetical protein